MLKISQEAFESSPASAEQNDMFEKDEFARAVENTVGHINWLISSLKEGKPAFDPQFVVEELKKIVVPLQERLNSVTTSNAGFEGRNTLPSMKHDLLNTTISRDIPNSEWSQEYRKVVD